MPKYVTTLHEMSDKDLIVRIMANMSEANARWNETQKLLTELMRRSRFAAREE